MHPSASFPVGPPAARQQARRTHRRCAASGTLPAAPTAANGREAADRPGQVDANGSTTRVPLLSAPGGEAPDVLNMSSIDLSPAVRREPVRGLTPR